MVVTDRFQGDRSGTYPAADWFNGRAEDPCWILDTVEFKTAWHPIGV